MTADRAALNYLAASGATAISIVEHDGVAEVHAGASTPNVVRDPLVDPGNPSHRYQARSTAHLDRPRSRMVALAASPPGPRSPRSPQTENATEMLGRPPGLPLSPFLNGRPRILFLAVLLLM